MSILSSYPISRSDIHDLVSKSDVQSPVTRVSLSEQSIQRPVLSSMLDTKEPYILSMLARV